MLKRLSLLVLAGAVWFSGFVIRDSDDYVAVFSQDGSHLFTTSIHSPDLPETDQESLKTGIMVGDEVELWSILEDFGS